MNSTDLKRQIAARLGQFARGTLADNTLALLSTLGYRSEARVELESNAPDAFLDEFDPEAKLDPQRALLDEWKTVDFLFQLTGDDLTSQLDMFRLNRYDRAQYLSYVFLAVELRDAGYARGKLAQITREINKLFPMPAMVLFKHRDTLTLAIINRRPNRRDAARDVLDQVTLIKDVALARPHRAHIEILFDLSLPQLQAGYTLKTFNDLHDAWHKTLDSSELNRRFFGEVANWYFWAVQSVVFPPDADPDPETRSAVGVIRLITRLIFVWFLKEKGLLPDALFDPDALDSVLKYDDPQGSTYYKAILQNLFFATLNTEMGGGRRFRGKNERGLDAHHLVHTVYRYQRYFKDAQQALALLADIPFLNGGLFECLDKSETQRVDGFSDRADNPLIVPDWLFFTAGEREADLNAAYGTAGKRYQVRGLIDIFNRYKFTIAENTPIEQEVALDPELLGQVFENLLATYNPETGTTARKQTGSFYTPREIVNYMVDESLIAYLAERGNKEEGRGNKDAPSSFIHNLRHLFSYTDEPHRFAPDEADALIRAVDALKILDPACGSGAFPMGVLHKLVFVLNRLDPGNARWRALQRDKALRETGDAYQIGDQEARQRRLLDIDETFERNSSDYGRKLYLIENCIYGVDIQPIAVQIAKLRFFISLMAEQTVDDALPNRGILPLPNLETKFVAANTLIGLAQPAQSSFGDMLIAGHRRELAQVRHAHFNARTPKTKREYRQRDAQLRAALRGLLQDNGWPADAADLLAHWDPYDQNASAPFFDPEWMFGIEEGFDVVIGNPPYLFITNIPKETRRIYLGIFETATYRFDVYGLFIEAVIKYHLKQFGYLAFIIPHTLLSNDSFETLRRFMIARTRLLQVIDIGPSVFAGTKNETMVFLCQRKMVNTDESVHVIRTTADDFPTPVEHFIIHQSQWEQNPRATWLVRVTNLEQSLLNKMESTKWRLGQLCSINQGLRTGNNNKYLSNQKSSAKWKQAAGGKEIGKYLPIPETLFVLYEPQLLDAPRRQEIFETKEKIVVQEIRNITLKERIIATYDDKQIYCLQSTNVLNLIDINQGIGVKYLLGILNSRAVNRFFQLRFPGNNHIPSNQLAQIPIPQPSSDQQQHLIRLVDQILALKRTNPAASAAAADTSALEAEIDQHVYRLYGLSAEEIAIVEA